MHRAGNASIPDKLVSTLVLLSGTRFVVLFCRSLFIFLFCFSFRHCSFFVLRFTDYLYPFGILRHIFFYIVPEMSRYESLSAYLAK